MIESGESSILSCELDPSPSSPTSLSSAILNKPKESMLEESEIGKEIHGSDPKRKRVSDKFEKLEDLLEKIVKIYEENDTASRKIEEKLLEMEERRERENKEFQLKLMSLLAQ